MRINLKGVSVNGNFETLPAGTYTVQLTDYGTKTAKDSGNEYVHCEFEITDGEFAGRKIWDNIVFTPTALWKFKAFAIATGFGNVDDPDGIETDDIFQNAMNEPVMVKVVIDKFTNKSGSKQESNKIESYIFDDKTTPDLFQKQTGPDDEVPF